MSASASSPPRGTFPSRTYRLENTYPNQPARPIGQYQDHVAAGVGLVRADQYSPDSPTRQRRLELVGYTVK